MIEYNNRLIQVLEKRPEFIKYFNPNYDEKLS